MRHLTPQQSIVASRNTIGLLLAQLNKEADELKGNHKFIEGVDIFTRLVRDFLVCIPSDVSEQHGEIPSSITAPAKVIERLAGSLKNSMSMNRNEENDFIVPMFPKKAYVEPAGQVLRNIDLIAKQVAFIRKKCEELKEAATGTATIPRAILNIDNYRNSGSSLDRS